MENFGSWFVEWFYVAILLLAGIGVLFFGVKLIVRLILFVACVWALWWAATKLGIVDETTVRTFVEQQQQKVMSSSEKMPTN